VIDGFFSSALSVFAYGSTVTRLFQGVAAVPLGSQALEGGTALALLGVLMHFGVAFAWSAVFLFLALRWPWVRRLLASPYGGWKLAALYGPFVWSFMSLLVIPLLVQRPPGIGPRWWVQFFGHIPFVGVPIVFGSGGAGESGPRATALAPPASPRSGVRRARLSRYSAALY
jgi:hypothetical protein